MIEATVYPVYTSKNQRSKLDIVIPVRRAFPDLLRLKLKGRPVLGAPTAPDGLRPSCPPGEAGARSVGPRRGEAQ